VTVGDTGGVVVPDVAPDPVAAGALRGLRLFGRWTAWVTLATFVAFTLAITFLVVLDRLDPPYAVFAVVSVVGWGACGAVLGWAEGHVLRLALPTLPERAWTIATAVGMALVWSAAIAPRALRPVLAGRNTLFLGIVFLVLIVVVVLALGFAQWLVLRRHLPKATTWVWVSAGAWLVAMMMGATVWTIAGDGQAAWATILIGALGALVVGGSMALLTGTFLFAALAPGRGPNRVWSDRG
jgi:hypothetical protein